MNRRKFITGTSLSTAGVLLTNNLSGCSSVEQKGKVSYDNEDLALIMKADVVFDTSGRSLMGDDYLSELLKRFGSENLHLDHTHPYWIILPDFYGLSQ